MFLTDARIRIIVSCHYEKDRINREDFIREHLGGDGYVVDGFVVDRNHPHGEEVHSLTDKGIIIIHNLMSGRLCTKLIARKNQVKRYYETTGREKPPEYEDILKLAEEHEKLGYHKI